MLLACVKTQHNDIFDGAKCFLWSQNSLKLLIIFKIIIKKIIQNGIQNVQYPHSTDNVNDMVQMDN